MIISDTGTVQGVQAGTAQKDLRAAGREAANRHKAVAQPAGVDELRHHVRQLTEALARRQAERTGESGRWLFENFRLVRSAARDVSDAAKVTRELPAVTVEGDSAVNTRAYAAARDLLAASEYEFSEEIYIAFLSGYQERCELQMAELWAMRPELELVLLEQLAEGPAETIPALLASLRRISEAQWQDLFEAASVVERILERDPAGAYAATEADSRDTYRNAITDIAKCSDHSEHEIAEMAIAMARQAAQHARGHAGKHPALFRRTHVGFYLIDAGLPALRRAAGYRPSFPQRLRDALLKHPNGFYLSGIEIVTFVIVIGLLTALNSLTPVLAGFFLLILPATQAAVEFMNHLTTSLLRPRPLPKLDFSEGVPEEFAALVAVPALLLNEEQVRGLALDLEIRFLANHDPNLSFALVTDCPDADRPEDERDKLAELCCELIDGLNRTYGNGDATPFYLFHRHRIYNASEGRWMGWERKRGKLLDLNQLLRGRYDSFPVKAGNLRALSGVRYVITLDSDTQLPRGAAARLVGAMAHPLNRPVVDAARKIVTEGYAILQPRIGISVESASRSRLASIYSGQTGFDIYTRAVSDVYQDL